MDFIHRLNPFIGRPPSQKKPYPGETTRLSVAIEDTTEDHFASSNIHEQTRPPTRTVYTPGPPPTPTRHRTPSILRSLAHRSSLSALKSKSARRRPGNANNKNAPPLPELPSQSFDLPQGSTTPLNPSNQQNSASRSSPFPSLDIEPYRSIGKSSKKLNRFSLKGSKSVPHDLRRSDEGERSSSENDPYPPIVSPSPLERIYYSSPSKRKPVPRVSPNILATDKWTTTVVDGQRTPESVRVRMSFDVEIESPSGPRHLRNSHHETTRDTVNLSPQRIIPRHLSSPPKMPHTVPLKQSAPLHPPRMSLPFRGLPNPRKNEIVQHPHPPPLPIENGHLDYSAGDFEPLTDSGRPSSRDDGLDILVVQERLPSGTPGGKKADLRRGALVDGQPVEKGATRFFSRDTYPNQQMPSTPSTESPSPKRHQSSPPSSTANRLDTRRSASPFEVKLSPMVTKRMSLDAFGTTLRHDDSPEESDNLSWDIEEELQDEEVEEERHDDSQIFQGTCLSTIKESPSSRAQSGSEAASTDRLLDDTNHNANRARGPASMAISDRNSLPLPIPFDAAVTSFRRHTSAPPLDVTRALFHAQSDHVKALKHEIKTGREMIDVLKREMEMVSRERQNADKAEIVVMRMTTDELERENTGLRNALRQTQTIYQENEKFLREMKVAHDRLAERFATLEEEKLDLERERDELKYERSKDVQTLLDAEDARRELEIDIEGMRKDFAKAIKEKNESSTLLDHAREQIARLAIDNESLTMTVRELRETLSDVDRIRKAEQLELLEKDKLITDLRDKAGTKGFELDEIKIKLAEATEENEELKVQLKALNDIASGKDREMEEELSRMMEEREELAARLNQIETEDEESCEQIEQLSEQVLDLTQLIEALQIDLQKCRSSLSKETAISAEKEEELVHLRSAVADADEALVTTADDMGRQLREVERHRDRLLSEVKDLQARIDSHESALKVAMVDVEMEKSRSEDSRSRLSSYLMEIDRLKLIEAGLRAELSELRRVSADDEMKKVELDKRVKALEEDKEMLNVALDSKQLELTLFQRRGGKSDGVPYTPMGKVTMERGRMAASTSRIGGGRQGRGSHEGESTPVPKRQLSQSEYVYPTTVVSKPTKREATIYAGPGTIPRPRPAGQSSTTHALGSTTKHNMSNRTIEEDTPMKVKGMIPSPKKQIKKCTSSSSLSSVSSLSIQASNGNGSGRFTPTPVSSTSGKGLTRRSSLPVLAGRSGVGKIQRKVTSLVEVEEDDSLGL